jgi:CheY-like chemotaxis protein
MRILVVDDVRALAFLLRQILEGHGHEVEVACGGDEALAKAATFVPELVLCDLNLDAGLSGYDVARTIRAAPSLQAAYLVALTGYDGDEETRAAKAAGFVAHLAKPVSIAELEAVVAAAERALRAR